MQNVLNQFNALMSNGGVFNRVIAIGTMASKYVIALLLLFISTKWAYGFAFVACIVGAFVVGLVIRQLQKRIYWHMKYSVTIVELTVLQVWSHAITANLLLTTIFTVPLLINGVVETMEHTGYNPHNNAIGHVFSLLSTNLFGVERIAKLTYGAYLSFVFGLASLSNECVLLVGFGLIGAVEIDVVDVYKRYKPVIVQFYHSHISVHR